MAHIYVQSVFQNSNGLSKDRYVNTFHFDGPQTLAAADTVRNLIHRFYNVAPTSFSGLGAYISDEVSRASSGITAARIKVYWPENGPPYKPGEPVHEFEFALPTANGTNSLPHEVAFCSSFYATQNTPSRRGRIYLGPLTDLAQAAAGPSDNRPNGTFRDNVVASTSRLRTEAVAAGIPWCVWGQSEVLGVVKVLRQVTNGWVDNAWDTQRRRGSQATNRTTW